MKSIALILVGALLGAAIVWFGFTKQLFVLNNNTIISVNRFTGEAIDLDVIPGPRQQKLIDDGNRAEAEEQAKAAKAAATQEKPNGDVEQTLNEEQLKQLRENVVFEDHGGALEIGMHNPFHDMVITRLDLHVHCDGTDDHHPTVDRDYEFDVNDRAGSYPLTDSTGQLHWNLPNRSQAATKVTITKAFFRKKS